MHIKSFCGGNILPTVYNKLASVAVGIAATISLLEPKMNLSSVMIHSSDGATKSCQENFSADLHC